MKYHLYIICNGIILTYCTTPLVGICAFFLYTLFAWFHSSIYLLPCENFNAGSYCIHCKQTTGSSMEHCTLCKKCVPKEWKHSIPLNRCCPTDMSKKWLITLKLFIAWYTVLTILSSMLYIPVICLIPLHLITLKSTYRK